MTTFAPADRFAFQRLVEGRWSCRAFLPDLLPRETVETLLELAQRAPSWCNTQPWRVIVTEGAGTERFRAALVAHAAGQGPAVSPDYPPPAEYTGVHRQRRKETAVALYQAVGVAAGDRAGSAAQTFKNFELFGAPNAAIVTVERSQGTYGVLDTGFYVANFLLAAESLGLGAIPQGALAVHAGFIREYFQIPEEQAVLLGISFGRPDHGRPENAFRTARADLSEVVSWVSA